MTRSMAKAEGAAVPKMYPLQGDHKKPEVSQTGMIQNPVERENTGAGVEVQPQVLQPQVVEREVQQLQMPQVVQQIANTMNANHMVM